MFHAFLSGAMSPGVPFNSWYYQGFIGISYLYSLFYQLILGIEWISWLSYFYILLSSALFLFLFRINITINKFIFIIPFFAVLFFLTMCEHVVILQNARVAYLLCGASLLSIIILFKSKEDVIKNKRYFIGLNLLFLLGALTRSEPALATSLLFTCFAVVWYKRITHVLIITAPALIITLAIIAGIIIDINVSDDFHKRVEPDIEMQITVRKNLVPLSSMNSLYDSIRYEAATKMLWSDPEIITEEFLRSLIEEPPYTSLNSKQWQRTKDELLHYLSNYRHLLLLNVFMFILISGIQLIRRNFMDAGLTLLYLAGFFIAVTTQTYMIKMKDWSFSPFLSIFTISGLLLLIKIITEKKIQFGILTGLLLTACIFHYYYMINRVEIFKNKYAFNKTLYDRVYNIAKGETLLINPSSFQSFTSSQRPFTVFDYSEFDKLYFYESQIASLLPGYREFLEKECNCSVWNFSNFYRYLLDNNNPKIVYALSTDSRMDLIRRYLETIHDYKIAYSVIDSFEYKSTTGDIDPPLYLYLMEKDER